MSGFPVIPQEMEHSLVTKAISHADQGFGLSKRVMIDVQELFAKQWPSNTALPTENQRRHGGQEIRRAEKLSTTRSKVMSSTVIWAYFKAKVRP